MLCYCFCCSMNTDLGDCLPLYDDLPAYDVLLPICYVHNSNSGCGQNGCMQELESWVVKPTAGQVQELWLVREEDHVPKQDYSFRSPGSEDKGICTLPKTTRREIPRQLWRLFLWVTSREKEVGRKGSRAGRWLG
jgi:hypothetical protein